MANVNENRPTPGAREQDIYSQLLAKAFDEMLKEKSRSSSPSGISAPLLKRTLAKIVSGAVWTSSSGEDAVRVMNFQVSSLLDFGHSTPRSTGVQVALPGSTFRNNGDMVKAG